MTDQQDTVAAADAAGGQFAKAFLPGLVLGLVLGLFIGAWLPPFFGDKPELVPAGPGQPMTEEERHRGEAGEQPAVPATSEQPAATGTPETAPPAGGNPSSSPG